MTSLRWASNAVANIIGGIVNALTTILITGMLAKSLDSQDFTIWNIGYQVIAYTTVFNLGLQTSVARLIAFNQTQGSDPLEIVLAARKIGKTSILVASAFALVLSFLLPGVVKLSGEHSHTYLLVVSFLLGLGSSFQIGAQAEMGLFQGLHKNFGFVYSQVITRLAGLFWVFVSLWCDFGLIATAAIYGASLAALWPVTYLMARRQLASPSLALQAIIESHKRELLSYSQSLTLWNLSSMVLSSAGVIYVSFLNISQTNAFATAMTASFIVNGFIGSSLSPFLTIIANKAGAGNRDGKLGELLLKTTMVANVLLACFYVLFIFSGYSVLVLWLKPELADMTFALISPLLLSIFVRNMAAPYSLALLATKLHKRATRTVLLEVAFFVCTAIPLGYWLGALGVALANIISAVCGVLSSLVFNARQTRDLVPDYFKYLRRGFLYPALLGLTLFLGASLVKGIFVR